MGLTNGNTGLWDNMGTQMEYILYMSYMEPKKYGRTYGYGHMGWPMPWYPGRPSHIANHCRDNKGSHELATHSKLARIFIES